MTENMATNDNAATLPKTTVEKPVPIKEYFNRSFLITPS